MKANEDKYRQLLLDLIRVNYDLQEILETEGTDGANKLALAAQLLADDPEQPPHVQEGCRAFMRGRMGSRAGLSPGETIDREVNFQDRQQEGENESPK